MLKKEKGFGYSKPFFIFALSINKQKQTAMKMKVSMLILSHLSDVQEMTQGISLNSNRVNLRINFVKYLILKYKNTDTEVDPEIVFEEFKAKHSNLLNN